VSGPEREYPLIGYFSIPTAIRTKTPAAETAGLGKDPVRGVGAAEVA